ncbi:unnamed protein product, partial [Symbiodinium necroappetens]
MVTKMLTVMLMMRRRWRRRARCGTSGLSPRPRHNLSTIRAEDRAHPESSGWLPSFRSILSRRIHG